jgi:hypothetical protein
MAGAHIFIAVLFTILGAAFVASTALLIHEFQSLDWLTMVVTHGHLFLFFPIFGLLALVAFYLPSVVLTHLYWTHVRYGGLRLIAGAFVAVGLAWLGASYLDSEPRSIYEVSPQALRADKADPSKGRVAILDALADLRKKAQERFGLSSFGRSCEEDRMLETPEEMLKERYCFPAGANQKGYDCCAVQKAFRAAVGSLQKEEATRSLSGTWDTRVFLPVKTFFIVMVIAIAGLLAWWRNRIDQLYGDLVAPLERGVMIGAIAMLLWLTMDYGYQQVANVLFGRMQTGPQLRLSLVLVPWALLLLFYFLRRLGKQGELVGQISGVVFAGVAVARYEQLNDWIVRLVGIGARWWMPLALAGIALVGLIVLFWPKRLGGYATKPAVST